MHKNIKSALLLLVFVGVLCGTVRATDRFFRDEEAKSPSGQYHVVAKSPDNRAGAERRAFQRNFVYTCRDTRSGRTVWTRKQKMGKPQSYGDGSDDVYTLQKEGSPVSIYVSDSGWTVIYTGWNELICVDPQGHDSCKISLLDEGLTPDERKKYVHETTAGPIWTGYSYWYFAEFNNRLLFVIRCWWDRHIIVDVAAGKLAEPSNEINAVLRRKEKVYVLNTLTQAAKPPRNWTKDCDRIWPVLTAIHMAGRIGLTEAVPYLKKIEDINYSGSCGGGLSDFKPKEGGLNPNENMDLWVRQFSHLSLRRLGAKPGPYPNTYIGTYFEDYRKKSYTKPPPLKIPREKSADKIKLEMIPEDVVKLIGNPDFIGITGWSTWEYDMDAELPYTLILHWGEKGVSKIERRIPPLWKSNVRDNAICN